jgi:hypothetical protein
MGKSDRYDSDDFEFDFSRNRDRDRREARKHKQAAQSSVFSSEKEDNSLDFYGENRSRDWRYRV